MTTMTKAAALNENAMLREQLETMRLQLAALISAAQVQAPAVQQPRAVVERDSDYSLSRPIILMTRDKAYAFKAREQLARRAVTAVKQVVIRCKGASEYAYAVY